MDKIKDQVKDKLKGKGQMKLFTNEIHHKQDRQSLKRTAKLMSHYPGSTNHLETFIKPTNAYKQILKCFVLPGTAPSNRLLKFNK